MKKIIIVIACILGFGVAVAAIVPFFVDVDKYRPKIVQLVNERINGKLELGKLSLSLWGQVRVEVAGVNLTDAKGKSIVSVNDAYFHLPFLSLISRSPALTLKLVKPAVTVIKDKSGKINLLNLMKSDLASGKSGAAAPQGGGTGTSSGTPAASGEVPAIAARARLGVEFRNALFSYRDEAAALTTDVRDLNLLIQDISLTHPMHLELWADLDTRLGKTFLLRGPAKLTATAKPQWVNQRFDHVEIMAKVDLDPVEMSSPGVFEKKKGMDAHLELKMRASENAAKIEKMDLKFFNAVVETSGEVTRLSGSSQPDRTGGSLVVQMNVKSNEIDLKPWVELIPMLKGYELGGSARMDAKATGPVAKPSYQAKLEVNALTAKAPRLKSQPRIDLAVHVATDQIQSLSMSMKAPGNEIKIRGNLASFTAPHGNFEVTSPGMDLDQLIDFPPPQATGAGAGVGGNPPGGGGTGSSGKVTGSGGVAQVAAAADYDATLAPLRENPALKASAIGIGVNLRAIKAYNVKMADVVGRFYLKNSVAGLEGFAMKIFGGAIKANLAAQLAPKPPSYRFDLSVSDLDLAEAVSSQLHLFKNTVVGKAYFSMSGEGASFNPGPATSNLRAKGNMRVLKAAFASIDVGKMASDALNKSLEKIGDKIPQAKGKTVGALPGKETRYEVISSDFTIANGQFSAPNFQAKAEASRGIDLKGATAVGLKDYSLQTSWEIIDTYNLTHARDISVEQSGVKAEHILAEGNQPVKFPVHAGCTLMAPCYSYTEVPEFLGRVALNNVSNAVQGRARSELKKQAESLIQKAPPAVQNSLQDLQKKLFH